MAKYIVVHSGARDQYKLAESLYRHGKLGYLVTDDILFRKEYRNLFPRSVIKISYPGLLIRFILKVHNFGERMQQVKGKCLGRTAGRLSKRKQMPLLALQEYAYYAYQYSDVRPRIVFQFHPQAQANKTIFEDEIRRNPQMTSFASEISIYTPGKLREAKAELEMTDYFIAASSFTKKTLVENGANPSHVFVAPYGVDTSKYPFKERSIPQKVQFVFLGSFVERKGASYLLKAIKRLEEDGYSFGVKIISRSAPDLSLAETLGLKSIACFTNVSHAELIRQLHASDVFVFPSLFEGFAFVIVEAMATGLPVISTPRTCAPDVITEGEEGFLIASSDIGAIYEKMKYFILHPEACPAMGEKAAHRAQSITWQDFENSIIAAVDAIENPS